ncbi:MAG: hypothetical protein K8R21_01215, partial [Leptospira sp.]|nr:hypothetical protein [Leptospira sp.]
MKLSKLYSNDTRFKEIRFTTGLNVIKAEVKDPKNMDTDTHDLGKSTVVELIDFLLLKNVKSDFFLLKHIDKFSGFIFFLELQLNNNQYITIKRAADSHTKISIKAHREKYQSFQNEESWNYDSLSLNAGNEAENPIYILSKYLNFDILEDYSYRKALGYFIRKQVDYNDLFHLSKFVGKHKDWKPIVFQLLGFDSRILRERYDLIDELESKSKAAKEIEINLSLSSEEKDKISGLLSIKENEKSLLLEQINSFNFYDGDRNITQELVNDIDEQIADFNSQEYRMEYEVKQLKDSIGEIPNFDLNAIERTFNEVKIYFPEALKKDYSQLLEFNRKLITERNEYIRKRIVKTEKELQSIQQTLFSLNNQRKERMSKLLEVATFNKYKSLQEEVYHIEEEIGSLKERLQNASELTLIKKDIHRIKALINELTDQLDELISVGNEVYSSIRLNYSKNVKFLTSETSIISIGMNEYDNIEFTSS